MLVALVSLGCIMDAMHLGVGDIGSTAGAGPGIPFELELGSLKSCYVMKL
jgi:hypothetical protein